MKKLFLFGISFLIIQSSYAANWYVDGARPNDSGDGTSWSTAKKYNASGIGLMAGGDTLYIKSGTYTGINNKIDNIPSGSAGAYTVIRGENDFGVVLSGFNPAISVNGDSYIRIEGIKVKNGTGDDAVSIIGSHHIKLFRISVKNGVAYDARYGNVISISGNSHDVLLEDCWVCGAVRYGFLVYESYNVILRRCVARFDGNDNIEPKSGVCFYGKTAGISGARDSIAQNCIAIDFNDDGMLGGGFTNPHSGINIKHYGCIALNIPKTGFYINEDGEARGNQLYNCVSWDNSFGFVCRDSDAAGTTLFDQVSAGANSDKGFAIWGNDVNTTIKNSIFYNNGAINDSPGVDNYNLFFNTGGIPAGATNSLASNPLFDYVCRIETDSPAYQSGEAGKTRGANVLKRYGTSGTLWGESGYDTLSNDNLWPWPYEDQIKADFSENDEGSPPYANTEIRGFCAAGQTLTKYIWGYLGNAIPSLEAPSGLSAAVLTSSSIALGWTDNSSMEGGFKIERKEGSLGVYSQVGTTGKDTFIYTDTGLQSSTAYYYKVRAYYDVYNSNYSNETSATTTSGSAGTSSGGGDGGGGGGGGGGGCFIATVAFGTPMEQEVITLCKFRDKYMLNNWLGRKCSTLYYRISPPIAGYIRERDWAKKFVRQALKPVVWCFSKIMDK